MTAKVVSAILNMTGVQSSLPVEDRRVSTAPLMMSIPEDETQERLRVRQSVMDFITGCVVTCVWVYLWGETQMSYPDTAHETSAPAQSLAWETLQRKHTLKHTHRPPAGDFITRQHLRKSSKSKVHT